ncbi:MAG TPA: hypothetical protein VGM22_20490 [Methylomirabilota bacterium]
MSNDPRLDAAIDALRRGRVADAQERFLATMPVVGGPKSANKYLPMARAAQAYREAGRVEDGRAFLHRALDVMETVVAQDWSYNGFLLLADEARRWQLPADEERLLRRELGFREKAGHGAVLFLRQHLEIGERPHS